MSDSTPSPQVPVGTVVGRRPTTLSARAAERLANGPLDAVTLMRDVCRVDRLQKDAAERMALALLSSHPEFFQTPSGHWALRDDYVPQLASAVPRKNVVRERVRSANPDLAAMGEYVNDQPHASLSDINFAVVDVETTGTRSGAGDRVTEIAIAQVRNGEVVDVYSQLVNPERPIPSHISALTHITWAMVKDQPSFRHIADDVTSRLAGHVFVAHNAAFDWRFVGDELLRTNAHLSGPRLCTVRMTRVLLPQLSRRSLDHVTNFFGINITSRHRAAGDAEATAHVLLKLLGIAEDEGLTTWPLLESRLVRPLNRRSVTASDKRRRSFPHPVSEDYSA